MEHGEFVFTHVVGCTRQSLVVGELLTRLASELVMHFDLPLVQDFSAEKLAWDLPRLLEAAGAKGSVLLVIDGLHRLRNDQGEINLAWLPQEFPPNVRVVLSSTLPPGFHLGFHASDDDGPKRLSRGPGAEGLRFQWRVLAELKRRKWNLTRMRFSTTVKRSIMRTYLEWHEPDDHADEEPAQHHADGSVASSANSTLVNKGPKAPLQRRPSLLVRAQKKLDLFAKQHATLEAVPTSSLTLATFLRALVWSAARGFDAWDLQAVWLHADENEPDGNNEASDSFDESADEAPAVSAEHLFDAILDTWEAGHEPDEQKIEVARRRSTLAGSLVGRDLKRRLSLRPVAESESDAETASEGSAAPDPASLTATLAPDHRETIRIVSPTVKAAAAPSSPFKTTPTSKRHRQSQSTAATMQAVADARYRRATKVAGHRLAHTLDVASLVTDRLLEAARADPGVDGRRGFLEAFLKDLDDVPDDDAIEAPAPLKPLPSPGHSLQEGTAEPIGFDSIASDDAPGPAPPPAAAPDALEDVADNTLEEAVEEASNKSDDEYGDDDYEDDYGDEFEDDFDAEEAAASSEKEEEEEAAAVDDETHTKEDTDSATATTLASGVDGACPDPAAEDPEPEPEEPLPAYLLGGADRVPGLGTILGDALALLCVARYGLIEDELWALLRDLDQERKEDAAAWEAKCKVEEQEKAGLPEDDAKASKLLDEKSSNAKDDDDLDDLDAFLSEAAVGGTEATVFPPELVEELPRMLAALGVLWDPQERVLVLPLESEALRTVVHRRYVAVGAERVKISLAKRREAEEKERNSLWGQAGSSRSTPGVQISAEESAARGGDWWHARVAAYFASRRPSRRRAEELPWHLKQCRQWTPLCDALSDVRTFETMFLGPPQMKLELAAYWKLLVDGPLYLSENAAHTAAVATMALSTNQVILSNLDAAHALGLVESRARRDKLQDQVATFDVVDAYTRSVDAWTSKENPTTHRTQEMLSQIGDFLLSFSKESETPPPFLRGALDWSRLEGIGVTRPKYLEEEAAADDDDASAASIGGLLARVPGASSGGEATSLYHYERWLWVQFPWLALAHGAAVSWTVGDAYDDAARKLVLAVCEVLHEDGRRKNSRAVLRLAERGFVR